MRKINVEELGEEGLEQAITKVSAKINEEVDKACSNINELLSRYGLACRMKVVIDSEENLQELKTQQNTNDLPLENE
jgi:hypothetical protein